MSSNVNSKSITKEAFTRKRDKKHSVVKVDIGELTYHIASPSLWELAIFKDLTTKWIDKHYHGEKATSSGLLQMAMIINFVICDSEGNKFFKFDYSMESMELSNQVVIDAQATADSHDIVTLKKLSDAIANVCNKLSDVDENADLAIAKKN